MPDRGRGGAQRARWAQYRAVWAYAEGRGCRRAALLRHFGDPAPGAPTVPCCDVCDPTVLPAGPAATLSGADRARVIRATLDGPVRPLVERSAVDACRALVQRLGDEADEETLVRILRGRRSREIARRSWDGLPEYGAFADLSAAEVLALLGEAVGAR
ncbi:RecQ family zinc-binding domain-containing protein [Conexibacter sp. W3-3-2]|uniref:RecQ family zinc-binding domain-containing protein n=1 Tax=Conexibacter sp. W3-3-2 TaxID=2675227 RepID=UPI0028163B9E|nr:RecQ family zinc-binding domain-containing protein [Conexibacter sp. W3-3-2]